MLKSEIRKEIKNKFNQQSNAQRLRKSQLIKEKLFNLAEFKQAEYVMFYIATKDEVETDFMITAAQKIGKKIAVPTILRGEKRMLRQAQHSSRQPERSRRMIVSLIEDLKKELTLGPYKILQPRKKYIREIPRDKIDLVVVPGRAFDQRGNRLGRGGGYYDKFLASLPAGIPRIGLAFNFQVLKCLPKFSHDISVTRVISA